MPSARVPKAKRAPRSALEAAVVPTRSQDVFKGEVQTQINSVRRRLGAIVESVCGGTPRAQDITDRFGVYRKLGLQIWNVVYGDDVLAAIKHLPNPRTLKVWHDAARKKGVREDLLDKLDDAIAQFRKS